ncbi:MAG: hypothetical protein PVG81_04955 [Desulfobacterales bacterium]
MPERVGDGLNDRHRKQLSDRLAPKMRRETVKPQPLSAAAVSVDRHGLPDTND